jgi:apolipoprotein N-acyltransferase
MFGLLRSGGTGTGVDAAQGRSTVRWKPFGSTVRWKPVRSALLAASLFTLAEAGLQALTQGMPWFQFHFGNALAQSLYAIQCVSYMGIYGLSFVVVWVNYAIAQALRERKWIRLLYPLTGVLLFLALGYSILLRYELRHGFAKRSISISILSENIPTSQQWDSLSGDSLVGRLLNLAGQASMTRPNINLWSESAIPWTYSPQDDLVKEIDRLADAGGSTQVLGMNTAFGQGEVYNSAYCIAPGGVVTSRYDKQVLLLAIEQRWNGWLIPFFSSNGYAVHQAETSDPLKTPYGPAGIMICNESTLASVAGDQVLKGARFLLNLSNDGWFGDTYLVPLHFYNARLRAVETRRDVAINSNNGISGLIDASGRIIEMKRDVAPFLLNVVIHPRQGFTFGTLYPSLPLWICGAFILWSIASILYTLKRNSL